MRDAGTNTARIFDCSQNKVVKKINAPSGYMLDFFNLFDTDNGYKPFIGYRKHNFENDKMMVTLSVYAMDLDGTGLKKFVEYTGENALTYLASDKGVLFYLDPSSDGAQEHYDFVTPAGEVTQFETYNDYLKWHHGD